MRRTCRSVATQPFSIEKSSSIDRHRRRLHRCRTVWENQRPCETGAQWEGETAAAGPGGDCGYCRARTVTVRRQERARVMRGRGKQEGLAGWAGVGGLADGGGRHGLLLLLLAVRVDLRAILRSKNLYRYVSKPSVQSRRFHEYLIYSF